MAEKVKLEVEVLEKTATVLQNYANISGLTLDGVIDSLTNFIPETFQTEEGMLQERALIELSPILPAETYRVESDTNCILQASLEEDEESDANIRRFPQK